METPVDVLYQEYKALNSFLNETREISFQLSIETQFKKSLVMASASYFETEIVSKIEEFYSEKSSGDNTIISFVRNKAIKRQYHTYFSWEKTNGYTQFFGLLGQDFQTFIKQEMKENEKLSKSLESFISIGNERNLLAHLNFASYDITKTIDEIYELFKSASYFVNNLQTLLRRETIQTDTGSA